MILIQIWWEESVNLYISKILSNNEITAIQPGNMLRNNTITLICVLLFY